MRIFFPFLSQDLGFSEVWDVKNELNIFDMNLLSLDDHVTEIFEESSSADCGGVVSSSDRRRRKRRRRKKTKVDLDKKSDLKERKKKTRVNLKKKNKNERKADLKDETKVNIDKRIHITSKHMKKKKKTFDTSRWKRKPRRITIETLQETALT